ncbi:AraC family transcriptional regulator [Kaistella carnis]|uniref:AraC family transcriptional regulator n=1 Tax=Kaistella carnis TaxID=1241979 RepID=UPI00289A1C15|nr:helix-turn-helix domain-containing protein [Kaistella carnis]
MQTLEYPIQIFDTGNIFDFIAVGRPHHPKNPAFLILKKGKLIFTESLNSIKLGENCVALIDSRQVYELQEISENPEILVIAFAREYTEKLPLKINRLNAFVYFRNELVRNFCLEPKAFTRIWNNAELLQSMLENGDSSANREEIIRHLFSAAVYQFGDIISQHSNFSKNKVSRKQEITLQFLKNVGEHFLQEREVTWYAEKQFITSRHLSALLKEVTGKTAGQILAAYVMKEAKALLSSTEKSMYEISMDLKFSDQYSFGHFFKKHSGESPAFYRKRFRH